MNFLAFDFGGTRGRCCLADAGGAYTHLTALARQAEEDGGRWLRRLLSAGAEIRRQSRTLKAVAVSFGGPVTPDGRVLSMHVPGWEKIDLKQEMKAAFGLPVHVENDANAGALGEHRYGAGRGTRCMAYFTVSTGIGGGVILDGKLYRGAHGFAAEFGQMVMHPGPDAPQYAAGKPGVLEALACGPAIARDARAALAALGRPAPAEFTARNVFDAAQTGERWAAEVLEKNIAHLARGVAAAICAYDVERVVIGGGVSLAGEALFGPLREKVNAFLPHFLEKKADVAAAALGDQAALLGAVAATADELR